jgi:hypothetical protein
MGQKAIPRSAGRYGWTWGLWGRRAGKEEEKDGVGERCWGWEGEGGRERRGKFSLARKGEYKRRAVFFALWGVSGPSLPSPLSQLAFSVSALSGEDEREQLFFVWSSGVEALLGAVEFSSELAP